MLVKHFFYLNKLVNFRKKNFVNKNGITPHAKSLRFYIPYIYDPALGDFYYEP